MADETEGKQEEVQNEKPAGTEGEGSGEKQRKMVPLEDHVKERKARQALEAKLREYETADQKKKESEMSELELLKTQNETLAKQNADFLIRESKREALNKAVEKLGKGFTLEKKRGDVERAIQKLSYDEKTIEEDIFSIVRMAADPVKIPSSPLGGGGAGGGAGDVDPMKMSGKQLQDLQKSDPERFKEVMAQRRDQKVNFPTYPVQSAPAKK